MILLLLLAIALIGLALVLALRVALGATAKSEVLSQVGAYGFKTRSAPARTEPNAFQTKQIANEIGEHLIGRLTSNQIRELRQLLNSAGYYETTVTQYLGYRFMAVICLPLLVLMFSGLTGGIGITAILVAAILAALAWLLPKSIVERTARQRTAKIDYEMPELVDLLVTTIEAGLGFGTAMQLCARRVREPLGAELRLTLGEQAMGLTMNESLKNMLERTNKSTSMRAFVQAIVQGETMGVSIGKTLRDLALDMRKRRRQAAEERAQKAPIKLLFPLTFLILPAMMIVILGPAVRAVAHGLGGG